MKKFLKLAAFVIVCVSLIISMIPSASAALAYVDEDFEGYSTGTMFTLGNSNFIGEIAEKDGNKYLKMVMNSDEDTGHVSWWYPGQSPEDASVVILHAVTGIPQCVFTARTRALTLPLTLCSLT